jgi:hypothetical protein
MLFRLLLRRETQFHDMLTSNILTPLIFYVVFVFLLHVKLQTKEQKYKTIKASADFLVTNSVQPLHQSSTNICISIPTPLDSPPTVPHPQPLVHLALNFPSLSQPDHVGISRIQYTYTNNCPTYPQVGSNIYAPDLVPNVVP